MSTDAYGYNGDRVGAGGSCHDRHRLPAPESQPDVWRDERAPHRPCRNGGGEIRGRAGDGSPIIIQHADTVIIQGGNYPPNDYRVGGPDFRRYDPDYGRVNYGPSPWEMQQQRDMERLAYERTFYQQRLASMQAQRAYDQQMAYMRYPNYNYGAMTPAGWDGYGGEPRLAIRAHLGHGVVGEISTGLGGGRRGWDYPPAYPVGGRWGETAWDRGYTSNGYGWNSRPYDDGYRPWSRDPYRDYAYSRSQDYDYGGYRSRSYGSPPGYYGGGGTYAGLSMRLGPGVHLNLGRLFG